MVKNFSRHPMNADQMAACKQVFGCYPGEPLKSFFSGPEDLIEKTQDTISSIVAPMGILLEALSGPHHGPMKVWNSIIVDWAADESARKRGRFAAKEMRVFEIRKGKVFLVQRLPINPTVENNYSDNQEFPYEG